MPLFIRLLRFTPEGAKGLKQFGTRRAEFAKTASKLGIKIVGEYVTTGRYDLITILDAPNLDAVLKLSAKVASQGRTMSETLSAVTAKQFEKLAQSA